MDRGSITTGAFSAIVINLLETRFPLDPASSGPQTRKNGMVAFLPE
jgi:hypothetical protein